MKLAANLRVRDEAGLALALSGQIARAENMAETINKEFPVRTMQQRYWIPTIRAAIELHRKKADKAVELLQLPSPYELSCTCMGAVYLRGQAFLVLHHGAAAAAEFQKIIDHPGVLVNGIAAPLAHLGLARAYALQGDTTRARAAYQDFLTLWKDADPDIPVLKQAKAEYARLK